MNRSIKIDRSAIPSPSDRALYTRIASPPTDDSKNLIEAQTNHHVQPGTDQTDADLTCTQDNPPTLSLDYG